MATSANVEIERKFLVNKSEFLSDTLPDHPADLICQGYWSSHNLPTFFKDMLGLLNGRIPQQDFNTIENMGPKGLEMRVRQRNDEYFVTFKSRQNIEGGGVMEFEYPLEHEPASFLLHSTDYRLSKVRHCLPLGEFVLEVDVFDGMDLVLAEVEIPSMDTPLPKLPSWVGEEVTGQHEYMNRTLSTRPRSI